MLGIPSKIRRRRLDGDQGFTLIELLVVVVILGILIAIAIPVYLNYKKSANDKAAQSDIRNSISVFEVCNSDGSYPGTVSSAGVFDTTTSGTAQCGTTGVTSVNLSSGTSIKYTPSSVSAPVSYIIVGTNSGGSSKFYCYNSATGGSVKALASGSTINSTC